jgi:hypothetical protein
VQLPALLAVQETLPPNTPKPQISSVAEKPTPRAKARELLDGASNLAVAAKPQVSAAGLFHLAYAYEKLDRRKALEFYQQAFASTATLSAKERRQLQPDVISAVAQVDLPMAIEMLNVMRPAPSRVVSTVVGMLLQNDEIAAASELVDSTGSSGEYSFEAVEQIFKKVPMDDPKRLSIFSSALSAYRLHPDSVDGRLQLGFVHLVARHWQEIPTSMAQMAMDAILNSIFDRKDDPPLTETISTEKGVVSFNSQKDADLFEIINVVHGLDPKRTQEILEKRPDLRKAFETFPGGRASMANSNSSSTDGQLGLHELQEMQRRAHGQSLAGQAMAALETDSRKALDIARDINDASTKVRVLAAIARSVSKDDPERASTLLAQSISMLNEIKDPRDRGAWAEVAEAAHNIKDDKQAWEAIYHGVDDATALYKLDADEDSPNMALREYWPSTHAYRSIVSTATKLFGVDAEPLLMQIHDSDLVLLAQIEIASTLLGVPGKHSHTDVSRESRKN